MTRPIFFRLQDELAEVKAERDRLRHENEKWSQDYLSATADRTRMREALTTLRQWDMLDACADGPWAKRLIDGALEARRTPTGDGGTDG